MVVTWVVTLPAAAAVGALAFALVNGIGGDLGVIVMSVILAAFCTTIYVLSRRSAVNSKNVNDAWEEKGGASHEPALAG
jgi:PiT family inorganic phosphate transporter